MRQAEHIAVRIPPVLLSRLLAISAGPWSARVTAAAAWHLYAQMEMQPRAISKRLGISVRAVNARLERIAHKMGMTKAAAREATLEAYDGPLGRCKRCGLRLPHGICVVTPMRRAS